MYFYCLEFYNVYVLKRKLICYKIKTNFVLKYFLNFISFYIMSIKTENNLLKYNFILNLRFVIFVF